MAEEITRRNLLKGAAVGAASMGVVGILGGCASSSSAASSSSSAASSSSEVASSSSSSVAATSSSAAATSEDAYIPEVLDPTSAWKTATDGASNFSIFPDPDEYHGPTSTTDDTVANLMSAMTGETGATTKYAAFSEKAAEEGFNRISALFAATSEAEDIHRHLEEEVSLALGGEGLPDKPEVEPHLTDQNVIAGARGEIYETSDMYPTYIAKAIEEAEAETDEERKANLEQAVFVFTRAKLAEAVHAKMYMDAYATIDAPTDDTYYLCPICGYIHKGENFTKCPICLTPKAQFKAF